MNKLLAAFVGILLLGCSTAYAADPYEPGSWSMSLDMQSPFALTGDFCSGNDRGCDNDPPLRGKMLRTGTLGVAYHLPDIFGAEPVFGVSAAARLAAWKGHTRWNHNVAEGRQEGVKDGYFQTLTAEVGPQLHIRLADLGDGDGVYLEPALLLGASYLDVHAAVGPAAGNGVYPTAATEIALTVRRGAWAVGPVYTARMFPTFELPNDEDVQGSTRIGDMVTHAAGLRISYSF